MNNPYPSQADLLDPAAQSCVQHHEVKTILPRDHEVEITIKARIPISSLDAPSRTEASVFCEDLISRLGVSVFLGDGIDLGAVEVVVGK